MTVPRVLSLRACEVDRQRRLVVRNGVATPLTPKEAELLDYLLARSPEVVHRDELLRSVWEYSATVTSRTLDTTVYTLRAKIEAQPADPEHILTVRGVGYQLVIDPIGAMPSLSPMVGEADRFVGRSAELAQLEAVVNRGARLMTLVGTAGAGKTRLARRFAATRQGIFPGGVWFCDLSEARSRAELIAVVAHALGVPLQASDAQETLPRAIEARGRTLLILDNFEHLVAMCASAVGQWVSRAPSATFLLTSRQSARLPGEHLVSVGPLGVPAEGERERRLIAEAEAVRLFVDRASAVDSDFALTERNASDIAEIVRILEGLPLSVELAAARVRLLSPAAILARLDRRFELLGGASRAEGGGRQATLWDAIDVSWQLLEPWEQAALLLTTVFRGGFDLEAAEAVLSANLPAPGGAPIDAVQALVDKSLIRSARLSTGEVRLFHYESVREFALEKRRSGACGAGWGSVELARELAGAERRHWRWFARCGSDERVDDLHRSGGGAVLRGLLRDLPNVELAFERATEARDAEATLALARILSYIYSLRGPIAQGCRAMGRALGVDLPAPAKGAVLVMLSHMRRLAGQPELARPALLEADAIAQALGDQRLAGSVKLHLGWLWYQTGFPALAAPTLVEAKQLIQKAGPPWLLSVVALPLGELLRTLGRVGESRSALEEGLAIAESSGDALNQGRLLGELGRTLHMQGRPAQARAAFERSLQILRDLGNRSFEAVTLGMFAHLLLDMSEVEAADETIRAALAAHRELGSLGPQARELSLQARIGARRGRMTEAEGLLDQADELARKGRDHRLLGQVQAVRGEIALLAGRHAEAEQHLRGASPILADVGDRHSVARVKTWLALAMLGQGDRVQAEALRAVVVQELGSMDLTTHSPLCQDLMRLTTRLGA